MKIIGSAVALVEFLDSDFGLSSNDVRVEAVRCELMKVSDAETKRRQKMELFFRCSLDAMRALHSAAVPDEEDEFALIPAEEFRKFVDAHATLCYELAHNAGGEQGDD